MSASKPSAARADTRFTLQHPPQSRHRLCPGVLLELFGQNNFSISLNYTAMLRVCTCNNNTCGCRAESSPVFTCPLDLAQHSTEQQQQLDSNNLPYYMPCAILHRHSLHANQLNKPGLHGSQSRYTVNPVLGHAAASAGKHTSPKRQDKTSQPPQHCNHNHTACQHAVNRVKLPSVQAAVCCCGQQPVATGQGQPLAGLDIAAPTSKAWCSELSELTAAQHGLLLVCLIMLPPVQAGVCCCSE
jgi:hypothetical protein